MRLKINNKVITSPIEVILNEARKELTNGKLKRIEDHGRNLVINCPIHKNGMEKKPSCYVLNVSDDPNLEEGCTHCFTCGYNARFPQLIADLFDKDLEFGEEWLVDRFCNIFLQDEINLPEFEQSQQEPEVHCMSESELLPYDFYHPYMWDRKLTKEVVDKFRIGYDATTNSITFPVYDEKGRLVMVTSRNVETKFFHIPADVEKPVYLLYDILQRGVTKVFICESQINTLTLRSWGYDSVGLFGTGSKSQLETLKKSGIREYYLCFDGDFAGRKGAEKFKKALGKNVFITDLIMPRGKDVNDLTKQEFESILFAG